MSLLASLLALFLPLSLALWFVCVIYSQNDAARGHPSPSRWLCSLALPALLGWRAVAKRSLSWSGLFVGLFVGFVLTLSNACFIASLVVFFITSSMATKFKDQTKRQIDAHYRPGGQRNWIQVVANGGVATELAIFYLLENGSGETAVDFVRHYETSLLTCGVLGAICCANGDTWASELGSVLSPKDPLLITSWRSVPKGTNGAVSPVGLVVSALGGLVVALAFWLCVPLFVSSDVYAASPPQWPLLLLGTFAGLFGSLLDSLLGATLQYSGFDRKSRKVVEFQAAHVTHICGRQLLDNNAVNLLSNLMTAFVTPYVALSLWTNF